MKLLKTRISGLKIIKTKIFQDSRGFAHGFMCLSKECTVNYKCSEYRNAGSEKTLKWDDTAVNIKWPFKKPLLSNKDKNLGLSLMEFLT